MDFPKKLKSELSWLFHQTFGRLYASLKDVYYTRQIKKVKQGNHFAFKNPVYVSQFADARRDLIIDTYGDIRDKNAAIRFGTKDLTEFSYWAARSCAIACMEMIIKTAKVKKFSGKTMDLVKETYALGGYDKESDTGWYHIPLIKLGKQYGLIGQSRKFISSSEIAILILKGNFIISSVKYRSDTNTDSHLFWIYGLKIDDGGLVGFWVNDPGNRINKGEGKFVPLKEFNRISTRRVLDFHTN